jgi:hypothetical protein
MSRREKYPEQLVVRLPDGTKARLQKARGPAEDVSDLVRDAIEQELKRREAVKRK